MHHLFINWIKFPDLHLTADKISPHHHKQVLSISWDGRPFGHNRKDRKVRGWPRVGPGHPFSPFSIHFLIFCSFLLFPFFIHFTYFLLLSILSLSTRIVPLHFQAGGCRKWPNLGLVFMAALRSRCGHYIFALWFLLFSSPNLSRSRLDVYHTSTHGVALVWI